MKNKEEFTNVAIISTEEFARLKSIESDFNKSVEKKAKELYEKNMDKLGVELSFNRYPHAFGGDTFIVTSHGLYKEDVWKYLHGIEDVVQEWAKETLNKQFSEFKEQQKTARHCERYIKNIDKLNWANHKLKVGLIGVSVVAITSILLLLF